MTPEKEFEDICERFDRLHKAFIDTSSIIYMRKSGFYSYLESAVDVVTIPDVIREAGMPDLRIGIFQGDIGDPKQPTDRKLIRAAQTQGIPLISEDRKILMICRSKNIEYYNAYMILMFLFKRGHLERGELEIIEPKLLAVARYGRWVIQFATELKWYVEKVR